MASRLFPQQSGGLNMLYNALAYQQEEQKRKEAEEERQRQLERQRRQQREANKHSAFGDTLKLVGTIGGAAVGSFTPVGPVGGAAIGSTLADATMAFAPNVGGTQPGADNPYYTPTTDTQKALTAVNAGLQFYSAYEADKIAKERALATADAKARSAEKLRSTDFQTAQSYVTSGFDAKADFAGSDARFEATGIDTAMPSLARDLKESGKYSFLKDEDFLMIAAGEADNYYKFGPTLETMTIRGTNMLYEALAQPDATAQSVLADLETGEAPWVKDFKRLPVPAQTAAKADLMKQSRATLAAANVAQKEKAGKVAEDLMDRAKAGLDRVNKRVEQIVKDEAQPPPGMTQQDFLGNWAADPSKMLTMLQVTRTQDPVEQYLAMQRVYGGQDTMILSAFPEDQRKIISGRLDTLGLAPQTAAQEKPATEVDEEDVTKRVEATNNSNVESQAEDSAKELVDRTSLVPLNVAEAAEDASKTREETEAEAEKISAKQIGMGSRAISTGQSTDDTEPAPTESEQFLKNLYLGRDPQSGEMSQELALRRDPRPETKMGLRQSYETEPEIETPPESERQVDTEQIDREKQSLVGAGPRGDRTDLLQSYGLPTEQPAGAAADPAVAPIQTSDMSDLQSLNALKDQVKAAPETRAAVPKEQAPEVSPLEQVLDLREAVDDKFQEINNKLDQAKAKVRQRGVRGETEMDSSLSERQAIYQTEAELSRIMTKFNSIEQQVMGQDSPSTRSPDTDQAYQDARDQYAELDQELAVLNTRLDKVLGDEQTSGRMIPRRGEDTAPDRAASAELPPAEVEPSAFETETLQNQINEAIRSYGKLSRGSGGISGVNTVKENTSKAQASSLTPDALARAASWFDQQNFIPAENPADNVSSLEFLLQQEINDLVLKAQYNDIPLEGSDDLLGLNDHAARARFLLRQIEQIQGVN